MAESCSVRGDGGPLRLRRYQEGSGFAVTRDDGPGVCAAVYTLLLSTEIRRCGGLLCRAIVLRVV